MKRHARGFFFGMALGVTTLSAWAGANPSIPFYGGLGSITADPLFPIVGETTRIEVKVGNPGDAPATQVRVKVSYNDWGVTFQGWQEIGMVTIADPIPAGGEATVVVEHVFESRAHTCVEALVVGADEDTNPDDNRGQINLEVVHAGETFSYGVPIRNNGDELLELVLRGGCLDKDPAGTEQDRCPGLDEEVVLKPGEEILVPVELSLAGVPLGEAVEYLVEAVDQHGNRNHVVLRVVHQTALQLKKQAIQLGQEAKAETPNKGFANRIETVIRHLRHAIGAGDWIDESHLERAGGARVFAQELAAVNQVLALLQSRQLPAEVKRSLNEMVLKVVDADRILAEGAMEGAAGTELEEATALLIQGDTARVEGRYPKAIELYLKAWHRASR